MELHAEERHLLVAEEVTQPRLELLRDCDEILLEEIIAHNLYRNTDQVFAVLLPVQTVGVMGDERSYQSVVAIRAVQTQDFMTADWARIPHDVLASARADCDIKDRPKGKPIL